MAKVKNKLKASLTSEVTENPKEDSNTRVVAKISLNQPWAMSDALKILVGCVDCLESSITFDDETLEFLEENGAILSNDKKPHIYETTFNGFFIIINLKKETLKILS